MDFQNNFSYWFSNVWGGFTSQRTGSLAFVISTIHSRTLGFGLSGCKEKKKLPRLHSKIKFWQLEKLFRQGLHGRKKDGIELTVGYLTVLESGKLPKVLLELLSVLAPNQGNVRVRTLLSLKVANSILLPSDEDHSASGEASTSSEIKQNTCLNFRRAKEETKN